MASSNIRKTSGSKKKVTQPAEKVGRIGAPATVPQPSLREIPRVNEKPAADIDTGNTASAAERAAAGRAVSSAASAASSGESSPAARDAAPQLFPMLRQTPQ